ncbi:MAG: hypothetical protein LBN10_07060 [Propionibacteriaceae bacterium]|jgi:beta-glucuronidase|nr:hypothetical protein [Propionibacteriaceae bacterium]
MTTEPANFAENIHRVDYLTPYAEPLTDAGAYIDLALRERESLDGDWHFAIDPYDTCLRARWFEEKYVDEAGRPYPVDFSFDQWETISVPSCWNVQKELWYWYEGSAVYVRNFSFEPGPASERVFLTFDGAAYAAYVFLNGEYLGWHQGASTPFRFEVTGKVRDDNRLLVVVNNDRTPERVPMDNTDWFNYGGLHRSVNLVRLPKTFIETASVALRPDGTYSTVAVGLTLTGPDLDGQAEVTIPELNFNEILDVSGGVGIEEFDLSPELWSPDNPKLYDVYIRYGADEWHDRVGFREIRVVGQDILLNGTPLFLTGVSQHEESVANGRSLTEEEIRENFRVAREMGCRYVRLAHYPHSGLTSRIADEVGMLLWEEVPVYWAIDFANEATFADADNQLRELLLRDRNRASVIIWSVGNENADSDARLSFMSRLVATCRSLDPTRLVSAACLVDSTALVIADRLAEHLDIIGINEYYGWYEPDFSKLPRLFENSAPTKPVIISEFGADAVTGRHGGADEMFTEENQEAIYRRQVEVLGSIPYIRGTSPWILYDFRCPRRVHVLHGYYNRKGLLSPDRTQKKLAFTVMQEWYKTK